MSWELILKEIPFKVRDFRAIDKKARKIWNDGGRKEQLSDIIVRLIKEKYNSSEEELLNDFKEYLKTLSPITRYSMGTDSRRTDPLDKVELELFELFESLFLEFDSDEESVSFK